ncbi:MAG: CDP-alcohol phosphatidyltransferase family protein [Clostridiales bacterium]|nr:CDP-alcohol phosphatidyltransferase family protein [Clostridiales bacterium]
MADETEEKFLTLPNVLTLLRLGLVPVFVVMSLRRQALGALVVFALAALTDFLDGLAARIFRLRTRIGTLLDPMADKLLLSTAFILLTLKRLSTPYAIPSWLTAAVIGRDLLIVIGAYIVFRLRGTRNFPPSLSGKISTVCQALTVFCVLIANYIPASASLSSALPALYVITLASTALSGAHYVILGIRMVFFAKDELRQPTYSGR